MSKGGKHPSLSPLNEALSIHNIYGSTVRDNYAVHMYQLFIHLQKQENLANDTFSVYGRFIF